MKIIWIIFFNLIAIGLYSQNLSECGLDDHPNLSVVESEFLNQYLSEKQLNNIDLTDKKVLFVTGNSAHIIGTKSAYFNYIKEWKKEDKTIASWAVELSEEERISSGGYDVIITYWVKILTKKRKRKIIKLALCNRTL